MKKACFYVISIALIIIMGLVYTGEVDIDKVASACNIVPSRDEAVSCVYNAIKVGDVSASVRYVGKRDKVEEYAKELVEDSFQIDDENTTDDYDYMKNKYRGYTAWISGVGVYTIHYKFQYSETKVQTAWVNEQVAEILKELNIENKSEYIKVKTIHDYIIKNLSYDITVKYNSAYEGLKSNATACQGYANLAYKMLMESGVNCRVITGMADKEPHAWNIVEVKGKWYNIDCTWDDPIGGMDQNNSYDYFLKSNQDFKSHKRDEQYNTTEFNEKYKMASHSWK